eukprot:8839316-Alexandrium_andersonii.AAC.1
MRARSTEESGRAGEGPGGARSPRPRPLRADPAHALRIRGALAITRTCLCFLCQCRPPVAERPLRSAAA